MEKGNPGNQRVFQHPDGGYILLIKTGEAISFVIDPDGRTQVKERLKGVDFRSTGNLLIKEGWKCLGPGLEYASVLEQA